ncbi:MAG: DMT family transporter [Paracoccaceae bacterium]
MTTSAVTPSPHTRGVATILATVFAMALADALVKQSSAGMTLWQIWVLRSLFVIPVLLLMARSRLSRQGLGWVLLRSLTLAAMYLGIYGAIPFIDLSVIAAALYTGPLFILVLSALVLGERIRTLHWTAMLTGFAGVLLIVRPLAAGFNLLTLLPIAAAVLYAVAAVLTRAKCAHIPATTLALWLNLTFIGLGGAASLALSALPVVMTLPDYPFLFATWRPMKVGDWVLIHALAALMIVIAIGLARAYQSPRPQVIATFDYTYLIFAAFWGYVFFHEIPDARTITGMVLVTAAGPLTLLAHRKDTVR